MNKIEYPRFRNLFFVMNKVIQLIISRVKLVFRIRIK